MSDDTLFESRLAIALERLADLAPAMDDESIARTAIDSTQGSRAGWLARLRSAVSGPASPGPAIRIAYLAIVLALLLAAVLIAVAGGWLRNQPLPLAGGNGAIVYTFGGNGHEAVTTVVINPDGTGYHPIEADRCPAYSRNGRVLTWLSYDGSAYLVAERDGQPRRRVLLVEAPQQSVSAAVSPEGTRVAWLRPVERGPSGSPPSGAAPLGLAAPVELWVAPLDGAEGRRIVPALEVRGESIDAPLWSPDGRLIAFANVVADDRTGEKRRVAIDVVAADGSGRRRLTTLPGPLDAGMAWSPDSRYLAYVGPADDTTGAAPAIGDPAQGGDLHSVGSDGAGDRRLTRTAVAEHDPEWSPDGAFIAFETSAEDVPDHVSVLQIDGNAAVGPPLTGPETDWFVWSPDGRQLLWQELTTVAPETFRTTLRAIDREFLRPSTTLDVVDGLIVCRPSWQRLNT